MLSLSRTINLTIGPPGGMKHNSTQFAATIESSTVYLLFRPTVQPGYIGLLPPALFFASELVVIGVRPNPIPNVDAFVIRHINRAVLQGDGHGKATRNVLAFLRIL